MRGLIIALALFAAHSAVAEDGLPPEIQAKKVGAGVVFTDQKGMTLYTYARDDVGVSNCKAGCIDVWPAVLAADPAAKVAPTWTLIERSNGKQWAYKGQALYSYVKDAAPGTSFGDGAGEAWFVAGQDMATPPEIAIGRSYLGRVLIDAHDMTLYTADTDKLKPRQVADASAKTVGLFDLTSACTKACLATWKPVPAPSVALSKGYWSVVVREDGSRQWAYQGKALYSYAGDLAATETRGDGKDRIWHAAVVEPAPPVPSWVTYEASDAGELLANKDGFTIYAFTEAANKARRSNLGAPATCDAECIKTFWQPVLATASDKPIGNWWIVKTDDGALQWAYKGETIYTHSRDKKRGDIMGTRFTGSKAWHTLMRSGQKMQGMGGN